MKVNLSYSVELDEVLPATEKLYFEAKAIFEKDYNVLVALQPPSFVDAKLETTMRNLQSTHQVIAHFASKLDEIRNILVGYHGVLTQQLEPPLDIPDELIETTSDEVEERNDE